MKSIELFAGIGGIALAAEWAGVETVAFCEREPFCQKVLNKHWPDVPVFDDVCTLNRKALEEKGVIEPGGTIDIISGGFPCQPYSIAGFKKGKADDRDLWPDMFRIIKELKPRWIVGENVANFANMELDRTLFDLESIGYRWRTFILPASAVGANHRRDRAFVVAYSDSIGLEKSNSDGILRLQANNSQNSGYDATKSIQGDLRNTDSKSEPQTYTSVNTVGSQREARESTSREFRGTPSRTHWETDKPSVCRVDDGFSVKLDNDRLKALGNAVVPQQIYPIFKYIMEIERMNNQ